MRRLRLTVAVLTFATLASLTPTALAAAVLAPLVLSKTCGVDASTCAQSDPITVTAGTDVTYCYTVQNNSGVTLFSHDLLDDKLGTILTSSFYALAPGASAFVTVTAPITATTVNVASWTASTLTITVTATTDEGAGQGWGPVAVLTATASDSCTVNVQIPPTEPDAGPDGCTDGIDNDQDGALDCGDVDCVGIGPCVSPAPVLGAGGIAVAGLILLSIGASSLLLRRHG